MIPEEKNFHKIYILEGEFAVCGIPDNGDDLSLSDVYLVTGATADVIPRIRGASFAPKVCDCDYLEFIGEAEIVPERVLLRLTRTMP
jgi:hypothetical protein